MAENKEETQPVAEEPKKPAINPKVFIIGLPIFVVQLIVVYFITANILLNKIPANSQAKKETIPAVQESTLNPLKQDAKRIFGKFIYSLDDVIVNPAGTSGQRLILASVNIDVAQDDQLKYLKEREPIVKDLIISIGSNRI
jgi:flagellar FliL protein